MAKLFDNVFENDSPGMGEWPETVRTVEQELAERQAKFDQALEQPGTQPFSTDDAEQT